MSSNDIHHFRLPLLSRPPTMPAVVSNATRIWEVNIHWDLYAQCGIWDQKGKGVDIWECVRARESQPVTCRFPPDSHRFVCYSRPFHARHSAPKQHLLEICGSTIDLSAPAYSQGATHRTLHPDGRDARNFITGTTPRSRASHRSGLSMYIRGADSSPARVHGALGIVERVVRTSVR